MSDGKTDVLDSEVDQDYVDNGINEAENYANQGDNTPGDSEPSGETEEGGQPSIQTPPSKLGQKARQRIDDWKKKRTDAVKKKALEKGKKAIQKLAKDQAKRAAKKAAVEGAKAAAEAATSETIIGPILIWLAGKALQLGKIAVKVLATGNYSQGVSEAKKSVEKPLKMALWIGGGIIIAFFLIIVVVFGGFFITTGGVVEKDRLSKLSENSLIITVSGPTSGSADQYLTYTIHAVSTVPTTNIHLFNIIPINTQYYKADGGEYDPTGDKYSPKGDKPKVVWDTKNTPNPSDATFTIIVRVDHNVHNTQIINFVEGISEESSGLGISGSSQQLAQLISNNSKIDLSPSASSDIKKIINNTEINNSDSCDKSITLNNTLLKLMLQLAQNHTYHVNFIVTNHGCDTAFHPKGRAMDIGSADGVNSWQNTSFRQDVARLLPSGGGLGQEFCPGSAQVTGTNPIRQFDDFCTHQHIDVGAQAP